MEKQNQTKRQKLHVRQDSQSYLILNNVAKDANFGFLIRTANAFGAIPVVVGRRRYSKGGAVAGTSDTPTLSFSYLGAAIENLRNRHCKICGIEIVSDAISINKIHFDSPTAFLIGNEGEGLTAAQKQFCDFFTYIPQYGNAVSLNINVATGIVLQRYASKFDYEETARVGEKFIATDG